MELFLMEDLELKVLYLLLIGHVFGDFVFQSDYMAKAKNTRVAYDERKSLVEAYIVLWAHSAVHGYFVYLVTGSIVLGLAETFVHAMIDNAKCNGVFGYGVDQALHVGCKVVWFVVAVLLIW